MDEDLRTPFASDGGYYCLFSGITFLDQPTILQDAQLQVLAHEAVHVHEMTHWHLHSASSIGLFLNYLHHRRWTPIKSLSDRNGLRPPMITDGDSILRLALHRDSENLNVRT